MQLDSSLIATAISTIALASAGVGAWIQNTRYLTKRMDDLHDKQSGDLRTAIAASESSRARIHERLDSCVKKDDLLEHITRLEKQMDRMQDQMTTMLEMISKLTVNQARSDAKHQCAPAQPRGM